MTGSPALKIINSVKELQEWRQKLPPAATPPRVGFVPTMGALHEGHARLLQTARTNNDLVVLSIFVNPTQFNDKTDLEKYPVTLEQDLQLAKACGVDLVFVPQYLDLYPDGYTYKVMENNFSLQLCGKNRPGHFDGVLSVVLKLFNLVQPHQAYFGEKDFQQLQLIQNMVKAFFLPIDIVPVPTVREYDGLAMSSRNVRLSSQEREWAPTIYRALNSGAPIDQVRASIENSVPPSLSVNIDYLEQIGSRRFAAVQVGNVRLIDNVKI